MNLIDNFEKELECDYKGEHYSVRDNGSIKRHFRNGKKPRPFDEKWTFGTYDPNDGYAKFCGEAVHRIVATAFHGAAPTTQHVVDHIDTNRQNNRPDNLRWVTKLENVLLNEITRMKLEKICNCPIEEILKNWSIIREKNLPTNISWMKAVSKEEAQKTLEFWNNWIAETKRRRIVENEIDGHLLRNSYGNNSNIVFRLEPLDVNPSLEEYYKRLSIGKIFAFRQIMNEKIQYKIIDYYLNKSANILSVATQNNDKVGIKSLFITTITIENNQFKYKARSFFSIQGIEKYMTLARGKEWTGGEVFDDFC